MTLSLCHAVILKNLIDLPWRDGNIEMCDAEMAQRVDDRVRNGWRRANRCRFAYAFRAEWMVRRGCDRLIGLPDRSLHRGWQR